MNMKANSIILSNNAHPLFDTFKSLDYKFIDIDNDSIVIEENIENIFDCTLISFEEKKTLLESFQNKKIICDTSCINGDLLKDESHISGAFALAFKSPTSKYEYFANDDQANQTILNLFDNLNFAGKKVSSPGLGFIYPRVICQIINEAYFALEEDLATPEDIDRAMTFGVNYPLGPIEWSKQIGHLPIVLLLDELLNTTQDNRYICSQKLRDQL